MVKVDLSIIILNYNTKDFLVRCLQSIEAADLSGIETEVLVVDNNSADGSVEEVKNLKLKIKSYSSKFKIIENSKNLGFSRGNNVGVKYARGRYVLFLNPDTVVSKDSLKVAYKFMEEHKEVGACTVRLELADGTLDDASHRGFPTPLNSLTHFLGLERVFPKSRIFARYTKGWLIDSKDPREIDSISGAFFFVRGQVGKELGWWDEDFFMFGEDLDFCYRLKLNGWQIVFIPWAKVLHFRGVASGIKGHSQGISTASSETRIKSARASTQAMRIFYKKHYMREYPKIVGLLVFLVIDVLEKWRVFKSSKNL